MTNHPSLALLYDTWDVMDRWDCYDRSDCSFGFRVLPILDGIDVAKIAGHAELTAVSDPTLSDFCHVNIRAFRYRINDGHGFMCSMISLVGSHSSLEWQYCDDRWKAAFIAPVAALFAIGNYSIETDSNSAITPLHLYG